MIIQTKMFEGKNLEEINQKINGFYVELSLKGGKVIKTNLISKNPYIMQLIHLVRESSNEVLEEPDNKVLEEPNIGRPKKYSDEEIIACLKKHNGDRQEVMEELGISRNTISRAVSNIKNQEGSEIPDLSLKIMQELKEKENDDRCTEKTSWGSRCMRKAVEDGLCTIHLNKRQRQEPEDAEEIEEEEKQYEAECPHCNKKFDVGEDVNKLDCPHCDNPIEFVYPEDEVDSEAGVAEEEEELIDEFDDEESKSLAEEHFKGKKKEWKTVADVGEKLFRKTLSKHDGNVIKTAKELDMNYQTAWAYSKRLKL